MTTQLAWTQLRSQWEKPPFKFYVQDHYTIQFAKTIAAIVKRCLVLAEWVVLVAASPLLIAIDLPQILCGKKVEALTVLDFYRGGRNDRGYTLREILNFDDNTLERKHDFIQWLFPLEVLGVNPTAPLTTSEVQAVFKADSELRDKMKGSFTVMLGFYGFQQKSSGKIVRSSAYLTQTGNWLTAGNHNFRRITRILHSLRLHGLGSDADAFLKALEEVYRENRSIVGSSIHHWRRA